MARWDLIKAVNILASRVTKWTQACDRALHKLVAYIRTSVELVLEGYVGEQDTADKLFLELFADADWAGDKSDYKSTSGCMLFLWVRAPDILWVPNLSNRQALQQAQLKQS